MIPLLLALAPVVAPPQTPETVRIDAGRLEGVVLDAESGLRAYRGVPYAAPPVGDLRWRPPRLPAAWEGVRSATEFGGVCPQGPLIAFLSGETLPETSEDCLYLNVWTAAGDADAKLPVMVWLHGGGFVGGWGHQKRYDGAALAREGVVLVSVGYRLGPLGFFAHPELSAESEHGVSGNYGFLDQIAALEWVQRNAAAFGGDPDRVTIFGESAGGTSVLVLCASPLAQGLFHRAIAQSTWITDTNFAPLATEEGEGLAQAERWVGSPDGPVLEALRALPADRLLLRLVNKYEPTVAVDGRLLTDPAEDVFARGRQNDVPLIAGTTAHEGSVFLNFFPYPNAEAFREGIQETYGERAGDVLSLYPVSPGVDFRVQVAQLITDRWFVRGTRVMLRGMARVSSPAWQYDFRRANQEMPALGAHHAVELPYVFNTFDRAPGDADRELARTMRAYWVQFARTGDPNAEGLPPWPAFEPGTDRHLRLDVEIEVGSALRKAACDLLDRIRAARREASEER